MATNYKVNHRQAGILEQLNSLYHEGMGLSSMAVSGEGQTFAGLIKRGFVKQRNAIFYITEEGQIALQTWDESQLDS